MVKSFVGTWKLISCEFESTTGEISYPFGQNPVGYIMYNDEGYMSVAIMKANRPKFAADDWFGGSDAEKAEALDGFVAYCGKYEVLADQHKVMHYPEVISAPNQTNVPQERNFEFRGKQLILSVASFSVDGEDQSSRLVWERV